MTYFTVTAWGHRGSSLVETVIAMGVLAVAIPLVIGTLAETEKSTLYSEAETRSTWIIPACLGEIQASRRGASPYFAATEVNEPFPAAGEIWALGFSEKGLVVGTLPKSASVNGIKEIGGKAIRYIAILSAKSTMPSTIQLNKNSTNTPNLHVQISLEFPATSPADKRQTLKFYTQIP